MKTITDLMNALVEDDHVEIKEITKSIINRKLHTLLEEKRVEFFTEEKDEDDEECCDEEKEDADDKLDETLRGMNRDELLRIAEEAKEEEGDDEDLDEDLQELSNRELRSFISEKVKKAKMKEEEGDDEEEEDEDGNVED